MFENIMGDVWMRRLVIAIAIALTAFLGLKAVGELMNLRYIGAGVMPANTIHVSGYGEAVAVPDIATFTYSVVSEKPTVAEAQEEATTKANAIVAYLKGADVAERDIQTTGYSVYPQYDYQEVVCVRYPCPGQQVLRGYEVRQTNTVKVRDTAKAGDLLTQVGSRGATEVSGLNFTFDNPDAVEAEARDKAIADAKEKAQVLARSLGVRLVRIVSFNESSGGIPSPIFYARDAVGLGGAESVPAKAPEISTGENKVTSNVSITYEIR